MRNFTRRAVWALVLAGAALRIWQYAGGVSLYVDELPIANDLAARPLIALLTEPLSQNQVAPPGFLLLEKIVVSAFGGTDFAMRVVPLLASLAALVLFAKLVLRVYENAAAVLAMALFATAIPLIDYSAQVKQYSLDVLATVLLLSVATELWPENPSRRARVIAALTGAAIVWFSQASVLTLCGLGVVLTLRAIRARTWKQVAPVVFVWAIASIAATAWAFSKITPATRAYLHVFWSGGFMPLHAGRAVVGWPVRALVQFFGRSDATTLGYPFPSLFVLLAVAGFIALWAIRRDACALFLAPIVVTLLAAAAHQYPFSQRLVMFLIPNVLLAIAAIPAWIASIDRPRWQVVACAAALLIGAAGVSPLARSLPVYRTEDIKSVLRTLHAQRVASDPIYVYYGAAAATERYAGQTGFRAGDLDLGDCHRADTRSYFRELDRYRGRRVWVVIQHAASPYRERTNILGYLNAIGSVHQSIIVPSNITRFPDGASAAYLYDLRDPQRLRSADAETFPLTGRQSLDPAFPCSGVAQAERRIGRSAE